MADPLSGKSPLGRRYWERVVPSYRQAVVAFLVAAVALLAVDTWGLESVVVPSSSMRPTILPNERIYLQRVAVDPIRRFDVVVIRDQTPDKVRIVKRVIGLPGDRVRLEDSYRVYINGQALTYTSPDGQHQLIEAGDHRIQLVRNPKWYFPTVYGHDELLLRPDEYYCLGDNRLASEDGRTFGPVKRATIEGKMTRVWYSYDLAARRLRTERLGAAVRSNTAP